MKTRIIIAFLSTFASAAQADLVTDNKDNKVSDVNFEILLESAPLDAQKRLLQNKKNLNGQLEELYLREALAKMAVQEGLDKQGLNAERLRAIKINALYLLKLDALRKENQRDYTKYAKQIYMVNQSDYQVAERVDAAHILVSTKQLSEAQALEKAQKIRQRLMKGENFSVLAVQESDDKSVKSNKGELGAFTRGQMVKPFSDVAFSLQAGEISEPVKTRFGYHIIKLNKKIPAGVKSFEKVKRSIISKLKQEDWDKAKTKLFDQLKKENNMQIDELAVDKFVNKKLDEIDNQKKNIQ